MWWGPWYTFWVGTYLSTCPVLLGFFAWQQVGTLKATLVGFKPWPVSAKGSQFTVLC